MFAPQRTMPKRGHREILEEGDERLPAAITISGAAYVTGGGTQMKALSPDPQRNKAPSGASKIGSWLPNPMGRDSWG